MTQRPRISVVIPTRDRPDYLRTCLEGFAVQTEPRDSFEVIVVDDGSAEPLDALAVAFEGRLDLRIERRPPDGVSAACNVGITLARGDFLILFDDDQCPVPDMVAHCLTFHEASPDEEDFLLLRLVADTSAPRPPESFAMFEGGLFLRYPAPGERRGHNVFWGGAVSCKKSVFRYGLYDPDYTAIEDAELGLRISQLLALTDHYDAARVDAIQSRTLTTRALLMRWCRMSYFHLLWQRNYPQLVTTGQMQVYRDAQTSVDRAAPMQETLAALEAESRSIGALATESITPPQQAALARYVTGMRGAVEHAQALGWLGARRDAPLEAVLEEAFGPA